MIKFEGDVRFMSLRVIHAFVCEKTDIGFHDLFAVSRKREIVFKRQIFFFLARKITSMSLKTIGEYPLLYNQSKNHHATVLHSSRVVNNLMYSNKTIRKQVSLLEKELKELVVTSIVPIDVDLLRMAEDFTENKKQELLEEYLFPKSRSFSGLLIKEVTS
jgi:hypothetical protein